MPGAPKGNTNAEKWTEQEAKDFVQEVEEYIADNEDCVFIGEAVTECGQYRQVWNYLSNKFQDSIVFDTIRVIESILENRLYKKGLTKDFSGRLVEFGLKNNHGWKDRKELDHTTQGDKLPSLQVEVMRPDETTSQ